MTPLDKAKDGMSGNATHRRVAAAEAAAAPKKKKKRKPATPGKSSGPNAANQLADKHAAARQRAIEAQREADRRAIIERQKKESLRR